MRNLSDDEVACIAGRARVLGDPMRVRILDALARGEHAVGRLAALLAVDEWTLSEHLQLLFSVGLVRRRLEAAALLYTVETTDLINVCGVLGRRELHRADRP